VTYVDEPRIHHVEDVDDPRVADYRTLRDTELRKRYENQRGVFIAEGPNVVRELLASAYPTRSVLLDERRWDEFEPVLAGHDVEVLLTTRERLDAIVAFPLHQGVIACGGRRPVPDPDQVVAGADRVLVLDAMNDHENMGAVFRTARALGVDAVLLAPHCADPLYRRCVRVSMGHVLHVPHARLPALPAGYDVLGAAGLTTVAVTPDPAAPTVDTIEADRPLALVLGAEGPGLAVEAMAAADHRARIPIDPAVDSLNVAMAAGIALHALRR
jgi:tRNA G18 (ribose-2'-O)-methylase SpoU